jgi:TolB-like protein/DNA-binding winged helix-turn-helix (wHTH) protein
VQDVSTSRVAIRFDVYELDLRAGELRKQGVRVRLQEQPFQILQALLERPGEVVTRDELRQRIWPADTFVDFDHGLYNAVKRLREALGDTADTPRFIETLPKRGYRFIGTVNGNSGASVAPEREVPVAPTQESPPVAASMPEHLRWRRILLGVLAAAAVVAVLLAAVAGGVASNLRRWFSVGTSTPNIHSLAVLPLQNLSGDPAQEYFADAMTDELITELSGISALKVISRTSVMRYRKSDKSLPEIAHELKVDAVVEGSVVRSGDRVRVTAQLIYAPNDAHLWAQTYDRDLRDVFTLQREIAKSIAGEVKIKTTPQESARLEAHHVVNTKALEAYLLGENHLHRYGRGSSDDEVRAAIACFEKAIAEDPTFARAYVQMGHAYGGLMLPANQRMPLVRSAAEKALAVDPNLAEAHFTLGRVMFFYEWNWASAEREFRRAIELNPSSAEAHGWLAAYLYSTGRRDEGKAECALAEAHDPVNYRGSGCYTGPGDEDRGIALLHSYLELSPEDGFAHYDLAQLYARKGMQKEHVDELERAATLFGFPKVADDMARAYATSGYHGALKTWAVALDESGVNRPTLIAEAYARLGDKDLAFQWLERAYRERESGMVGLNTDPEWASLRSDPRFKDLVRRVGLPER